MNTGREVVHQQETVIIYINTVIIIGFYNSPLFVRSSENQWTLWLLSRHRCSAQIMAEGREWKGADCCYTVCKLSPKERSLLDGGSIVRIGNLRHLLWTAGNKAAFSAQTGTKKHQFSFPELRNFLTRELKRKWEEKVASLTEDCDGNNTKGHSLSLWYGKSINAS